MTGTLHEDQYTFTIISRKFKVCKPVPILDLFYPGDEGATVWGRGEVWTGFWWGNLREGDHWGDPDVDGRIILGWIFGKWDVGVWTGWS